MKNGIQKIVDVVSFIEENITTDLDCKVLAQKMHLSVYEFRRIFSFVVGCPVSEYIRKRRLSLAAIEIMKEPKVDMLKLSEKYGYSNQSAFTRAFVEQHRMPPSACAQHTAEIHLFTCPKFEWKVHGSDDVKLRILKMDTFHINGFCGVSNITDTCCCEKVWNDFYEQGADARLKGDAIYVAYSNEAGNVICCIGEVSDEGMSIPATRWACFKMNTTDDEAVNEVYSNIIYEWLPSAGLTKDEMVPVVEVYPFDMSKDGFEWEIRIPVI